MGPGGGADIRLDLCRCSCESGAEDGRAVMLWEKVSLISEKRTGGGLLIKVKCGA
jgi:ketosteroid isomerase-like protein